MATKIVFLSLEFDPAKSLNLELGFSNGNPGGGTIDDLFPGLDGSSHFNSSFPHFFTQFGSKVIFEATDGAFGRELWITDGTAIGTQLLKDINAVAPTDTHDSFFDATNFASENSIDFAMPLVFNGKAYFGADDGVHGFELWMTDGTTGGTEIVKDINPTGAIFGANPQYLVTFKNEVYFAADDGTHHRQIWKTDGTAGNAVQVTNLVPGPGGDANTAFPFKLTVSGDNLYFIYSDGNPDVTHAQQLYVTDGTIGGEHLVSPSHPATGDIRSPTDVAGTLYFTMNDGTHGLELWKSNGTDAGTTMVKDIADDGVTYGPSAPGSAPFGFILFNGEVFFAAQDTHGVELWKTNGTAAGTTMVANINTTPVVGGDDSSINTPFFTIFNNELYFNAKDGDGAGQHGAELWKTNGTGPGTVQVADIIPGNTGSSPVNLKVIDGALYFGVVNPPNIPGQLMKYDGVNPPVVVSDNYHFGGSFEFFSYVIDNTPPVQHFNTGTTVNEGASTTILNAQLDFDDAQEADAQITYTVTVLPANGTLFRNAVALGLGGTFTQADIVGNLLSYTHNGSETTSDQFGFSVTDGVTPAVTGQTFAITVTPQNDPPVQHFNTGATVNEGGGTTILNAQLDFDDPDNTNAQIAYTVTALPTNGTLFRNAIALGLGGTFTQADIVGNLIGYTHNGSETVSDAFGFSVSDGIAAAITGQTFAITVTPQNDPPVISSNGGGATATVTMPENATAVTTVTVADPDGLAPTFSIVGGDDAAKFQINGATGALSFVTAPNFESPGDLDHNNSYLVQVRAFDGSLADEQLITVNITDVLEVLHWVKSVDAGTHPDPNPNAQGIIRGLSGSLAPGWMPGGIGDFNNDATSDLAWYNPGTNAIDIWKLSNGAWAGSAATGTHPAGYHPAGFGDLDHDGTADILWFNATTRDLELWKIANGQWAGSVDIGTHPAGYLPSGVGDFTGDGTADVLWYNATTRDAEIWKISNGQWAGSVDVGIHPAGYQPTLIGDFTGDGTADIGWYNATTNALDLWKIQNGQWAGSVDLGTHPAGWQPLGAADFNTDGTADIAWYNPTTNNIDVWLIKNGQWSQSVNIGSHPAGPVAVGVGDFDHNGVGDIAWFNPATGQIENWMLAYS